VESEVASRFTPEDIMQTGEGCSGATILDDDGYPNCHELHIADLLMFSSNQVAAMVCWEALQKARRGMKGAFAS